MPLHPPRHLAPVKQLETLAKRETKLRVAVTEGYSTERTQVAANGVREAQLRVLKARLALIEHDADSTERQRQVGKMAAEEAFWSNATTEEIVSRYNRAD